MYIEKPVHIESKTVNETVNIQHFLQKHAYARMLQAQHHSRDTVEMDNK